MQRYFFVSLLSLITVLAFGWPEVSKEWLCIVGDVRGVKLKPDVSRSRSLSATRPNTNVYCPALRTTVAPAAVMAIVRLF